MHEPTEPTVVNGCETHPAFGMISASRMSSTPGAVLFDSDIRHQRTVRVSISPANRQRSLNRDWIRGSNRKLIEVEMSEAQWASFVSSMNTSGVPCTLRATESTYDVPGLPYSPRMAESMTEVRGAAEKIFGRIQERLAEYQAVLDAKGGAKERREALGNLQSTVKNATANVEFAARSLHEHTEDVVQKARADIEAMVLQYAEHLQLDAGMAGKVLELPVLPAADTHED